MAHEDCLIHNNEHTKGECPDPDNFYCPCCFYYLPDTPSGTKYCKECLLADAHKRPPALTARSVWTA